MSILSITRTHREHLPVARWSGQLVGQVYGHGVACACFGACKPAAFCTLQNRQNAEKIWPRRADRSLQGRTHAFDELPRKATLPSMMIFAPSLNDILCYFTYVGSWRDQDPPDVIRLKRSVDRKIYLPAPLFFHPSGLSPSNGIIRKGHRRPHELYSSAFWWGFQIGV